MGDNLRKALNVKAKEQTATMSRGKLTAIHEQPQRTTRLLAGAQRDRAVIISSSQKSAAELRVRVGTEFTGLLQE